MSETSGTASTYDVHAHCIPDALTELLRADGDRFGITIDDAERGPVATLSNGSRLGPFPAGIGDTRSRLEKMDATGVDVQIVSSWVDLTAYALAPSDGAAYSRAFNEILTAEAAAHPDRFRALGTVPLQSPAKAADELRFAVEELGMVGVEIATTVGETALDQAGLEPFWEAAEALRCLVLIHPCNPLSGVDLSRNFLDNMVGRPAESTIAVAQLIFGGVLERYPDLTLCVVHGGGFVPFQLGRMQRGFDVVGHLSALHISIPPDELAKRLYYDTVLHDANALAFLVERVGADRVVMGTDYPFPMGDTDPVTTVLSIPGLNGPDRDLILRANVERVLDAVRH